MMKTMLGLCAGRVVSPHAALQNKQPKAQIVSTVPINFIINSAYKTHVHYIRLLFPYIRCIICTTNWHLYWARKIGNQISYLLVR